RLDRGLAEPRAEGVIREHHPLVPGKVAVPGLGQPVAREHGPVALERAALRGDDRHRPGQQLVAGDQDRRAAGVGVAHAAGSASGFRNGEPVTRLWTRWSIVWCARTNARPAARMLSRAASSAT